MGLLSTLGGAIKEGLRSSAIGGLMSTIGINPLDITGSIYNGDASNLSARFGTNNDTSFGSDLIQGKGRSLSSGSVMRRALKDEEKMPYPPTKYKDAPAELTQTLGKSNSESKDNTNGNGTDANSITINHKFNNITRLNENSDVYKIKLPDWNYADFINERAIYQKGLSSIADEPAWFYFKIFFDFDTEHGLFGSLLNNTYLESATNSAAKYLYSVRNLHKNIKAKDRINALYKFASILSYINTNSPWYFKSVRNLNKAVIPILDEFNKDKYIEIETLPDAIDMRLSTLMSLYYYACFDPILDKEIIPENLRKFNMTIILFQSPLRYLHTSYTTNEKKSFLGLDTNLLGINKILGGLNGSKVRYKSMSPNGSGKTNSFANTMSMQVITLYGCEFDTESLSSMIPAEASNETPFQLGNNTIRITYMNSMLHTMNEFYAMMFGTDGFYFNQYSNFQTSSETGGDIIDGYKNKMNSEWNKQIKRYETLSDTFSNLNSSGSLLGIIDSPKSFKEAIDATEAIMNGFAESKNTIGELGVNFALGLLGSSESANTPQGNLYGDYGVGSAYYKDKLEMLKNGVHERTTAPYYYDPVTGKRIDLHKSKNYSAYNLKNDISSIKNFNVGNWMSTNATSWGSRINDSLRS